VRRNAARLRAKVGRAAKRAGVVLTVNSFVRTRAEQQELFDRLGPGNAAVPGTSFHELGLAMDCADTDGDTDDGEHAIEDALRAEGLHTPLTHEDWHITEADRWG
jgi:LAS superfamily LD-carboxypeptidase LdcB